MSDYKYKNLLEQGYKQFKLTKKQHNELFPICCKKVWNKFEYYYNDNHIILHQFASPIVIVLTVIVFPIIVLINGFGNIKEIIREYRDAFNQKKYGNFISDTVWSNTETYNKIMKIIGKEIE
jgi:hypothetical protein